MCVATMDEQPITETPAPDVEGGLLVYSEEYRCPRCDSEIPKECVKGTAITDDRTFKLVRTVMVYCPHCAAGFEADFITRDGRLVRASRVRLVMDGRAKELALRLPNVFPAADPGAGDLVAEIAAAMDEEADMDKAQLAAAIESTNARLVSLQEEYRQRFGQERPLSPEEKSGIDAMAAESGQAEARLEQHVAAETPCVGGVPTPERTIDPSTSQLVGEDDGPVDSHQDAERFDGLS